MSDSAIDRARDVRSGEELPVDALVAHLSAHIPDLSDDLEVRQFRSGHSNLTYLLVDGEREFVLRRPPFGAQVKSGHDMSREWRILSGLYPVWPKVPRPVHFCEDESMLGAPFYVMDRVVGVILRGSDPKGVDLGPENMARVCHALVETFAEVHAIDLEAAGLSDLGKPEGYVRRQIEGWTGRWRKAMLDEVPVIDETAKWLADNMPPERGATLIHNDFKYDNFVLDPDDFGNVRAVLDWEMATLGDPLMDLGTTLGYWVDPNDPPVLQMLPMSLTVKPGNLSRQELVERYAELTGRDVSDALFYYVYGMFKLAVVAQQIFYRYKKGFTSDERFASLGYAVQALGETAVGTIARGTLLP